MTVPVGTKALQVTLGGIAPTAQTRFLAFHPFGLPVDSTASTACYSNRGTDAACNSAKRVYANPQPGVWELLVESRRTSPVASTPFTLSASLLGVTVEPAPLEVPTVVAGTAKAVDLDGAQRLRHGHGRRHRRQPRLRCQLPSDHRGRQGADVHRRGPRGR